MKKLYVIALCTVWLTIPTAARAQVGGGDLTFTPKNSLPVLFSHQLHVSVKKLKCADCHYQFFQMARGSYKMDMEKITKAGFCGKCHDGRMTFDVKDTKNCSRCHR
jgi:c(7)-type cytochrome triheme protein